jgi:hypothetical protein
MGLSDPFSTTYQGSMQAGESLGQGIQSAAGSIADAMQKKQQQQKFLQMIGMMKDSGAVTTESAPLSTDEYISQAEKTIAGLGDKLGAKGLQVTGSSDPEERKKQYQAILEPLGLDPKPKVTPKLDTNKMSGKYDISMDSDGKMTWKTKTVDPMAEEMKQERMDMQKEKLKDQESKNLDIEFDKLDKISNPNIATNRSPLGMAGRANMAANRALLTLDSPMVTNQEAGNVMADVASIYQNGSPTEFGMSEQGYKTVYAQAQAFKQWLTGQPQDALTPEVKQRLQGVLKGMKQTNKSVIKENMDALETLHRTTISKDPQRWKDYRKDIEKMGDYSDDSYSSNDASNIVKSTGMGGSTKTLSDEKFQEMLKASQGG